LETISAFLRNQLFDAYSTISSLDPFLPTIKRESDLDEFHPVSITFLNPMSNKAPDVSVQSMLQFDRLSSSTSLQSLKDFSLHGVRLPEW